MNQIEKNIIYSFSLAKSDIMKIQRDLLQLSQVQKNMISLLDGIKNDKVKLNAKIRELELKLKQNKAKAVPKPKTKPKKVVKVVKVVKKVVKSKPRKQTFVASKTGKSFHTRNCPFAKNIHPKRKVIFKTKDKALNEGYKPCDCIK